MFFSVKITVSAARPGDHAAEPGVGNGYQWCRSKRLRDGGRPPATGLQEQVANHRKPRGSKARVVSVTEKAQLLRRGTRRRLGSSR